jgi:hypothetical protein
MDNKETVYSLTLLNGGMIKGVSIDEDSELTCVKTPSGDCVPLGRFKLDRELMKLIKDNYEQIYT